MDILNALLMIFGGILALSGVIAIKRPDLKPKLDALVPFQALIGVGLVVLGVINFLRIVGTLATSLHVNQIQALATICMLGASILLGALFGWPIIERMIPDQSPAKAKAAAITQQIAPFQVLLGAVGILATLVYLLYRYNIVHYS
jgi:hypothetical protein